MNRRNFLKRTGQGVLATQAASLGIGTNSSIMEMFSSSKQIISYWIENIDILSDIHHVIDLMSGNKNLSIDELDDLAFFEDHYNIEDFFAVQNEVFKMNLTERSLKNHLSGIFRCNGYTKCDDGYSLEDYLTKSVSQGELNFQKLLKLARTPIESAEFGELRSVAGPMWKSRIEFLERMGYNKIKVNSSELSRHLGELHFNMAHMKKFLGGPVPYQHPIIDSVIELGYNRNFSCERYNLNS